MQGLPCVGVGGSLQEGQEYGDIDLEVQALEPNEAVSIAESLIDAFRRHPRVTVQETAREFDPDSDREPIGIVVSVDDVRRRRGKTDRRGLFDIDLPRRHHKNLFSFLADHVRRGKPFVVLDE